ncbi:MAG: redoxin domain-containing protein [Planctomycetales bacterium]|nr:redoxin domain-containing protein [Planctomycetales bacterium]
MLSIAPASVGEWFDIELEARSITALQVVGLFWTSFGLAGIIACLHPFRHWVLFVCRGLADLALGVGVIAMASTTEWNWSASALLLPRAAWLPVLATLLYQSFKWHSLTAPIGATRQLIETQRRFVSQRGATLESLSRGKPLLIVFTRHAGCTFCREMLSDLGEQRSRLEAQGMELAVVHMSPPLEAAQLAIRYGLEGVHLFSDPHCELYEAFGLTRGTVLQLLGPKVWWRAFWTSVVEGHGIGPISGDGFRLQGAFVVRDGDELVACRAQTAADPIDFISLCKVANGMVRRPRESALA